MDSWFGRNGRALGFWERFKKKNDWGSFRTKTCSPSYKQGCCTGAHIQISAFLVQILSVLVGSSAIPGGVFWGCCRTPAPGACTTCTKCVCPPKMNRFHTAYAGWPAPCLTFASKAIRKENMISHYCNMSIFIKKISRCELLRSKIPTLTLYLFKRTWWCFCLKHSL